MCIIPPEMVHLYVGFHLKTYKALMHYVYMLNSAQTLLMKNLELRTKFFVTDICLSNFSVT